MRLALFSFALVGACGTSAEDSPRDAAPADAGPDADAGDGGGGPVVTAIFRLPRGDDETFALPWPSDLWVDDAGRIDFSALLSPGRNPTLTEYVDLMSEDLRGYGTNGAMYFRFDGDVARGSLPDDGEASLASSSTVWLVDVTPSSPSYGERVPVWTRVQSTESVFWPAHTLAVLPVHGFGLRPETTYAVALTRGLAGVGGERVVRDADFEAILGEGGDEVVTRARGVYGPALGALEDAGLPRGEVVSMAVFTTMDPVTEMFDASRWAREVAAPPAIEDMVYDGPVDNFYLFTGHYGPVPILQHGAAPYEDEGSGGFEFDASGDPIPDHTTSVRFALSIPRTPAPAGGWPIVLYAHGTGGDYRSFADDRTAAAMAARGMAAMGIDQVLHGEREGAISGPAAGSSFFNYGNPLAGRDNNRQAAIDVVLQARVAQDLAVPALIHPDGVDVPIDGNTILFFGHSQGGLNGPLFLATDPTAKGAVFSGSAAIIAIALCEKEDPFSVPALVSLVLGLDLEAESFDFFHPVATLVQTWVEPSDPANYGPFLVREPRGAPARSILQTEGLEDTFATPNGIEALATSIGLPIIHPAARPVEGASLRGFSITAGPVTGNLAGGDGTSVTGGLLQYTFGDHFVVFDDEDARERSSDFLRSIALGGVGTIDAP